MRPESRDYHGDLRPWLKRRWSRIYVLDNVPEILHSSTYGEASRAVIFVLFFNTSHVGHLKQPFSLRRSLIDSGSLSFPIFNRPGVRGTSQSGPIFLQISLRDPILFASSSVAHSHAVCGELPQLTSSPPTSLSFSNSKLPAQHFQVFYTAPEVIRPYCTT